MKIKINWILIPVIISLFLIPLVQGSDSLTYYVTPLTSDGVIEPNATYSYTLALCDSTDCSSDYYNQTESIKMDEYGRGVFNFSLTTAISGGYINSSIKRLGEFKDGALRKAHEFASAMLENLVVIKNAYFLTNVSVDGVIEGSFKGYIKGAYPIYDTTTSVNITTGSGECNGHYFKIESDIQHTISVAGGQDFWYIYVDDSASNYPTPTIISSTTEPSFDGIRQGWYNGDDRNIGVVWQNTSAKLEFTQTNDNGFYISVHKDNRIALILNGNPTGEWQSTTTSSASLVPVNAVKLKTRISGGDADAQGMVAMTSQEMAEYNVDEYDNPQLLLFSGPSTAIGIAGWIDLGVSRNVSVAGEVNDDNILSAFVLGYAYTR